MLCLHTGEEPLTGWKGRMEWQDIFLQLDSQHCRESVDQHSFCRSPCQMYGSYKPNDAGQSKRFVDLSSKLSETLDKLRGNRQIAQKASTRILYLEASLSQLRSSGSNSSWHVDLTADSPSNYLTAINKFPHAGHDSSTAILQSDRSSLEVSA